MIYALLLLSYVYSNLFFLKYLTMKTLLNWYNLHLSPQSCETIPLTLNAITIVVLKSRAIVGLLRLRLLKHKNLKLHLSLASKPSLGEGKKPTLGIYKCAQRQNTLC